jgi:quercetin dioxygenase-like cupin family protein
LQPEIKHIFADGLYAKETHIPAGMRLGKHTHSYTHFSILAKGSVVVRSGKDWATYEAPACIEIKADIEHEVQALTDATWYCVHSTDETDEEKIDQVLIHKGEEQWQAGKTLTP